MWNCELAGWIIKCAFWWQKESLSNETQVTLEGVRMDAAGVYSCEVSADAPSFQTATVHGYMDIVGTFTMNFPQISTSLWLFPAVLLQNDEKYDTSRNRM